MSKDKIFSKKTKVFIDKVQLTEGVDYTITGNTLIILKDYIIKKHDLFDKVKTEINP